MCFLVCVRSISNWKKSSGKNDYKSNANKRITHIEMHRKKSLCIIVLTQRSHANENRQFFFVLTRSQGDCNSTNLNILPKKRDKQHACTTIFFHSANLFSMNTKNFQYWFRFKFSLSFPFFFNFQRKMNKILAKKVNFFLNFWICFNRAAILKKSTLDWTVQ